MPLSLIFPGNSNGIATAGLKHVSSCAASGVLSTNRQYPPWGISPTLLWQKAHCRLIMVAEGFHQRSNMDFNLFLFSKLGSRCNFQQQSRHTATFVHTHCLEAV